MRLKTWKKVLFAVLSLIIILIGILYLIFLKANYESRPDDLREIKLGEFSLDGANRTFQWYGQKSNSIIFVLHGSGSSADEIRKQTAYEYEKMADENGFVVVYPDGYENHWNDCRASADYQANILNIDDVKFLQRIEEEIEKELKIKFTKQFAVGFSNGGHFAFKIGLEASNWIDGIAAISANIPVDDNLDCEKDEVFVPIILINGTEDKINPYEGGLVSLMGNVSRGTVISSKETMNYWTSLDSNSFIVEESLLPNISDSDNSNVELKEWKLNGVTRASLFTVQGGGHSIPELNGNLPKALGATNNDFSSSQAIWAFFDGLY